jgi:hypothetical protein
MTDPETLLSQAAHAFSTTPSPEAVVDADLARGRRALNHRRMRRSASRSVLAAGLAVGAFAAVHQQGGTGGTSTATRPSQHVTAPAVQAPLSVKLVAYTGAQPDGYTVDSVPAGWEIQGVSNLVLAIAPVGFADRSLDSFEGKLVVMLLSADAAPPTTGVPVNVGAAGTGRISHENPEPILTFQDQAGHWLDIQVPASLHWTDAQVAAFGSAVHANATAEAGVG